MTEQSRRILIAGGGIGGLTAALCLARLGHPVTVLEQSAAFTEAGAGLQLSPNCVRVLHSLGLEAALREVAFLPQATQMRHWRRGTVIAENPLGGAIVERYGFPYYHIHRADLLALLLRAAQAMSSASNCMPARASNASRTMPIRSGVRRRSLAPGQALIGADGIHSKVREHLSDRRRRASPATSPGAR